MRPTTDPSLESRLFEDGFRWVAGRLPAFARPYIAALAAVAVSLSIVVLLTHAGLAPSLVTRLLFGLTLIVYLLVLMSAAWMGYGPGIAACLATVLVAPHFLPFRGGRFDGVRTALLLMVSLLISRLGQTTRRREDDLREAAVTLEKRVAERTEAAERAAAEARAASDELRQQAQLLDMAHDAILSMEDNGAIRFWNRGAETMYGWTRAEAVGRISHELLKTVFPEPLESIREHMKSDGRWEGQLIHTRRDGVQLKVASRWAIVQGADSHDLGFLEINNDVTERLRIEEQMRHGQKLESLGVLAGGVAHDFNNLLTGILGNASLALDQIPVNHTSRRLIDETIGAAERAADLTRQLLAYAGKGRFVMRTLDLSEITREMSRLVQTSFSNQVVLQLQLADHLPGIDADPGQMQQIVMNLVINGAEATGEEGGMVRVRTSTQEVNEGDLPSLPQSTETLPPGSYVLLEVEDNGSGMDKETLAKIFDPFFTTKFAGRGLGLPAVLGIVRAHKGALQVHSSPGVGTTFRVLFPASKQPIFHPPNAPARSLTGHGTLLVVDDEEIVRSVARNTLRRYGYEALTARSGAEAIEIYHANAAIILMILLDLAMPGMNGEETLRRLQALNPCVKVLLTSGFNEVEAVQRFAGKGLAGFIQKPYTASALAAKVKEVLGRESSA